MAPPGLTSTETGLEPAHRPHLGEIVRRVAQSLLVACVVPIALFYAFFATTGVWTAMVAALAWAYGAIAFRALTGRRASGLLILTATVLTGRTLIALAADSTFLYFIQPVISDAVVGAAFLLSLASARPMVARLAGDFYPMDHELSLRPRIRRLFRNLTIMWATLCLGKAMFVALAAALAVAGDLRAGPGRLGGDLQRARHGGDHRSRGAGRPQGGPAGPAEGPCQGLIEIAIFPRT